MGTVILDEQGTPATPPSGFSAIFFDETDGLLKSIDDTGVVTPYGGDGSSPIAPVTLDPVSLVGSGFAETFPDVDITYDDGSGGVGATITEATPTDGALVVDDTTPSIGDRVVVNIGNSDYDGIYVVTVVGNGTSIAWVLTRATDCDSVAKRSRYWTAGVLNGSLFAKGYVACTYFNGSGEIDLAAAATMSVAEGYSTASGFGSHAEGGNNIASAVNSHVEGTGTRANDGRAAHAEGQGTTAGGLASHAEGYNTSANSQGSHSEGESTTASGGGSHAEGDSTTANGQGTHAEGTGTLAEGQGAHAEGGSTEATNAFSHAEGSGTEAQGQSSHAEGDGSVAYGYAQHAHSSGGGSSAHGQYTRQTFATETSDATPTILQDGSTDVYTLPDYHRTAYIQIRVVARTSDGTSASYLFEGRLTGDGTSTYIWGGSGLGSSADADAGASSWTCAVTIDTASVVITVTGEDATGIGWTATLEADEIRWNGPT